MNDKIFDVHCHFNHGAKNDTVVSEFYNADLSFLLEEYDRLNILGGGFSSFDSVLAADNIFQENEYTAKIALKNKKVYQWIVLDPRDSRIFGQVAELLKSEKALGIKINSIGHKYPILKYIRKIFEFADKYNATILMHPDETEKVAAIAAEYPLVSLIIAHLGRMEHISALKNSKGNIYVDTSGEASIYNRVIEYTVNQFGAKKILFGTDTYSFAFQYGRIKYADVTEVDKEAILFNNTIKLFKKIKVL